MHPTRPSGGPADWARHRRSAIGRSHPALLVATMLWLVAACSSPPQAPLEAGERINLSTALAYREGDPEIEVVSPEDGATVTSPVEIVVETRNLTLSPPGETQDGEGHLHVLIDLPCEQPGLVIPTDAETVHGSEGMGRIAVDLPPGRHELCVQVGDGFHIAVAIQDRIVVNVVEDQRIDGIDLDGIDPRP
ncbi:MAG: DUF4399 domain-containing protein [Acidimicrobiales bacterium]